MSDTVSVARMEMDLKLVLDGVIYDCATFSMFFNLNSIPTAQAILAVGVCVMGGSGGNISEGEAAPIHHTAGGILRMQKAEVWFKPTGDWRPGGPQWPSGWKRIFLGYVTGFGSQKLRGSMRVTVNLIHWLADLGFSSALSSQTHPSSCFQYSMRGCYIGDSGGGSASEGKPYNVASYTSRTLFTPGNIQQDLWAKCLQPMFCNIADKDAFQYSPVNSCFSGAGKTNNRAQKALALMEGSGSCGRKPSKWYVPLKLDINEAATQMAKAIAESVGRKRIESFISTSLWDKLVNEYSQLFDFAICPRIESAIVCPFTPGLQTPFIKRLKAEEMSYLGIDANLSKPLRGVQIFGRCEMYTGWTDRTGTSPLPTLGPGGCYAPPGIDDDGLVLSREAPEWVTNVGQFSHSCSNTIMGGGQEPTSTATTPGASGGQRGDLEHKTKSDTYAASKPIFDRVAKSYYAIEMLRGRFGVVYGKLRFDIAPGSTVFVENTRELHLGSADQLGSEAFVATAIRVSVEMDAEGSRAGTGFQLAHVRTKTENENGMLSVDAHPIYNGQQWPGAPLTDDDSGGYLFDNDGA